MSGFRYNKGKARMSLLPFDALYELASLFTESTKKYPARNWERGLSWSETQDSLLRHMTAWSNREDKDAESGFYHDVHILWNAIVLVTMRLRGIGKDDRREVEKFTQSSSETQSSTSTLAPKGDGPTHPVKGDISNPVVPVTATDDPSSLVTIDNVTYMVRPYYDGPDLRFAYAPVVQPVSRKVE